MNICTFDTYTQLSSHAAHLVLEELENKPDMTLCVATGNSPTGMYQFLADAGKTTPELFGAVRILKLDEWGGLPADHPASCEHYLRKHVIAPLNIAEERFDGFKPYPADAHQESLRIRSLMAARDPADICILGVGKNGHLGFNEPAAFLEPFAHVARLSEESKNHGMLGDGAQKPEYGMTLGMQDILSSRRIILLFCGSGKQEAFSRLQTGKITTEWPVTFLWLHPRVDCLVALS